MSAVEDAVPARQHSLEERYTRREGMLFLTGTQALVRLPIEQRLRDRDAGRSTAGFIAGYRGSPLGGYDLALWQAASQLRAHDIHFQPSVNEDLAATAVWGSQWVGRFPGARVEGVFSIWYGKGPGVDRSGDPLKHGNLSGTSPQGGALVLAGDDHGAKSSTTAHQSEPALIAAGIPVLYPANVQEILEFGLHGFAIGRHSGCWVGLKLVTDVLESARSVRVGPDCPEILMPEPAEGAAGGVHTRMVDTPMAAEERLYNHKLPAVLDYVRLNGLNRVVTDPARPRVGIVSAGKAWADVRQALAELGLDDRECEARGVRLLKVGVVWPLDPGIVSRFADGLETILVIEEKRALLENQIKSILYDAGLAAGPRIVGKRDGRNEWDETARSVVSRVGELDPARVAHAIVNLLDDAGLAERLPGGTHPAGAGPVRMPTFCSGCPHNTSTRLPEGSRALAGIGCHSIALLKNPLQTTTMSHMGGEGTMWVGQAPFTEEPHVFANMGDGTYFHSGFLAVRQAVAAKQPITFKLLVNGFVSMTGGQPIDGELSVSQMARELLAEGVGKVAVVTDDADKYPAGSLPENVALHQRSHLDAVQRELRGFPGVSVLIYEQPCATERRRLRKRGKWPDPAVRTFIHPLVCEGCGDCGLASSCMSVEPLETEFGRKRRINQSSCNKDMSCVDGFCPSFITVHGGHYVPVRAAAPSMPMPPEGALPEPVLPDVGKSYQVLIAGVGGTGVVTTGALLAMAAHLDGLAASSLDVTGLAQKYGAVHSHIRLTRDPAGLHAPRIAQGETDLLLGCDLIVAAGDDTLTRLAPERSSTLANVDTLPTAEFAANPEWQVNREALEGRLADATSGRARFIDASAITAAVLGDSIGANTVLLGHAWQAGQLPVSHRALEQAIELNGAGVAMNKQALELGRLLAADPEYARSLHAAVLGEVSEQQGDGLDQLVGVRNEFLVGYQDAAYAQRYVDLVDRVAEACALAGLGEEMPRTVAKSYFKLLAHKDEYEVARLMGETPYVSEVAQAFEGNARLRFHLGGGPFCKRDSETGKWIKREVGSWILPGFRVLARARRWRNTWLDPFRNSADRRLARVWLERFEQDVKGVLAELEAVNLETALQLLALPQQLRGYGHVRREKAQQLKTERERLLGMLHEPEHPIAGQASA